MDRKRRGSRPTSVASGALPFRERRGERVDVDDRTELRHKYALEIRIRNLSTRGFMAECEGRVDIGSNVSIDILGIGPVHAQIRWQLGTRMGGMFLDPISLRQCTWTATIAEAVSEPATAGTDQSHAEA
jgi:hypothetical protein